MLHIDVLIFDMDGVLFDVSESYRVVVRQTTQFYFEKLLGLAPLDGDWVSREEVAAFKLAGGFNSDWDLTTALVKYFLSLIDERPPLAEPPTTYSQIANYLRAEGARIGSTASDLARRKNVPAFARRVAEEGGGLNAARKILGNANDHLLFASGDVRDSNLVARIFEEMYLGDELFAKEHGEAPQFTHGDGLIRREKLIPNIRSLATLHQRFALGIATGRSRSQAMFSLESHSIANLFRAIVAHDDIVAAGGFGKPHPFSLFEAARRITSARARCAYIGDIPDDIRAANAAKGEMDFVSIGCLAVAEDKDAMRREFERVGADAIIDHPDELAEMI